jgi:copper chaperone CopZ
MALYIETTVTCDGCGKEIKTKVERVPYSCLI